MLDLKLEFDLESKTYSWSQIKFIPTVTWYGYNSTDVTVYAFEDYTQELAATHGGRAYDSRNTYEYMQTVYESVIDKKYL